MLTPINLKIEGRMLDCDNSNNKNTIQNENILIAIPGVNTVSPVSNVFLTSTDPNNRSSSTFTGTCTKGHVTISVGRSCSVLPSTSRRFFKKSSIWLKLASGATLYSEPLTTSIGGITLCNARAITDFAVPVQNICRIKPIH